MRFIVEPTTKEQIDGKEKIETQYPKIVIEFPYDHMDIEGWVEMLRTIMRAVGFAQSQVDNISYREDTEE